jgi:hypothetical protein
VPSPPSSRLVSVEGGVFKKQYGLATRAQLLEHGVTAKQIRTALAQGRWLRPVAGLYALSNWPDTPGRRLFAACLLTGGVASHDSAAWLWGLLRAEPSKAVVSVSHKHQAPATGHTATTATWLTIVMHRSTDLVGGCISTRRGVPTTNPLRSLVDMAADAPRALLDEALDTALASRLVTVEGLIAEAMRLKRRGRRGPAQLLQCLSQRGFAGAPSPSVLESRLLRVLARAGIPVMNREVVLKELGYRLDIQLQDLLFLEVDGYAYHWSPEQKRHDDARRNKLWSRGLTVLVYDWKAVVSEPRRLVAELRQVLSKPTRKTASDRPKGGPVTSRRPS